MDMAVSSWLVVLALSPRGRARAPRPLGLCGRRALPVFGGQPPHPPGLRPGPPSPAGGEGVRRCVLHPPPLVAMTMAVARQHLVGGFLLVIRQAGIERLERIEE